MLVLIKRKLQNKKILNGCLLLGITLLIAIAASTPMLKKGSLNRLIQNKFTESIEENNAYSAVIGKTASVKNENGVEYSQVLDKIAGYQKTWQRYMDVSVMAAEIHTWINGSSVKRQYGSGNDWINIACIPEMEQHIKILKGISYSEEKEKEDSENIYPCVITEKLMDTCGFVQGEQITFDDITDSDGNTLVLQIVGIFDEADNTDIFWNIEADEFEKEVFVSEESMNAIASRFTCNEVYYDIYVMLDYSQINTANASDLQYYLQQFHEKDEFFTDNFLDLLKQYQENKKFIDIIFWVLELPVFVLLLAFIYMVSGQILSMETGEIAMFKSRGFSAKQIVLIYLSQSGIMAGAGIVLGLPLGVLFCKLAASTNGFLEFSLKSTAVYKPTPGMLPYAFAGALIVIAFMTIPVIRYSRDTIVEQKSRLAQISSVSFIEKYFIDVILLLISVYLLYNYNKQKSSLAWDVMIGEKLDPMVFLNLSLFLLACGLVGLRLIKYIVRLIYHFGRNKWKPHMYASFLQIMRTSGKRNFISVFLIFTIAMGIVNANVAGTINKNNEMRIRYNVGADVVAAEHWTAQVYMDSKLRRAVQYYEEPDYGRFSGLEENVCTSMTRVVRDDGVIVTVSDKTLPECSMMAVQTKEFGQTARLQDGLNEEHWYNYLNALAKNGSGVLISQNLAKELDLKVGDTISYSRQDPLAGKGKAGAISCNGIVCGIFDAWPGYEQYSYEQDDKEELVEKENYLLVVNYAYEVNAMGTIPYEIWMSLKDGAAVSDVRQYLEQENIVTDYVKSTQEEIDETRNSAMIQITNGLFSLSFLVSIILCMVGFLIYWITSIKQRELLFGIYRAMGMGMKEVRRMLLNEQVFSSLFAGVFGGLAGFIATKLFTGLIAMIYLPQSHNIALQVFLDERDMIRLFFVVLLMIGIALKVLLNMLKRSSITNAIKMGED